MILRQFGRELRKAENCCAGRADPGLTPPQCDPVQRARIWTLRISELNAAIASHAPQLFAGGRPAVVGVRIPRATEKRPEAPAQVADAGGAGAPVHDEVEISAAAEAELTDGKFDRRSLSTTQQPTDDPGKPPRVATDKSQESEDSSKPGQLSEEDQEIVDQLKARDREVRAHEQAHLAAAGPYAQGGPTYTYERGPDGQNYAVGGEVSIDTAPIPGDPEATIRKAQVIKAAAMAPAEPSAQDRAVAAAASQMEAQARLELNQQRQREAEQGDGLGPAQATVAGAAEGEAPAGADLSNASDRVRLVEKATRNPIHRLPAKDGLHDREFFLDGYRSKQAAAGLSVGLLVDAVA